VISSYTSSDEPAGTVSSYSSAVIQPIGDNMGKKLYVGNLPASATQDSLEITFGKIGEVNSVNLIKDRDTGQSKGFAFVEMTRDGDADKAIDELDGEMMDEREIKVNAAKPMRQTGGPSHRGRS
jgi:RNA recognition motif-containing protein